MASAILPMPHQIISLTHSVISDTLVASIVTTDKQLEGKEINILFLSQRVMRKQLVYYMQ